ncbi:hypothetical protein [Paenisporosarcina indica]|uniref:hypothetical protein n=1 Tax=Paenisporosarcina indica TaxID=650093 RepID=UPI00094F5054|nr:hypothetical protein [Paenisporosarcina indica]
MKKTISDVNGNVVLSYKENGYQAVVDDFINARFINIVTYNINTFEKNTDLIKELRKVTSSTPINLILNIPSRSEDYYKNGKIDQTAVNNVKVRIKYTLEV